jgi:hypothetical protein
MWGRAHRLTHHPGLWLTYQPGLYPDRSPLRDSPLDSPQPLEALGHFPLRFVIAPAPTWR